MDRMKNINLRVRLLRIALVLVAAAQVVGCSRTKEWQEEVLLNNGETIWVTRTVRYTVQGDAGNPLDMAYRPVRNSAIEFTWREKKYRYYGDAIIRLLAISPQQKPALIAPAAANSWDAVHHYQCTKPFYVQLVPDETGTQWTWPSQVEPWVINLPLNLLPGYGNPREMKERYSVAEIKEQVLRVAANIRKPAAINPELTGNHCKDK